MSRVVQSPARKRPRHSTSHELTRRRTTDVRRKRFFFRRRRPSVASRALCTHHTHNTPPPHTKHHRKSKSHIINPIMCLALGKMRSAHFRAKMGQNAPFRSYHSRAYYGYLEHKNYLYYIINTFIDYISALNCPDLRYRYPNLSRGGGLRVVVVLERTSRRFFTLDERSIKPDRPHGSQLYKKKMLSLAVAIGFLKV